MAAKAGCMGNANVGMPSPPWAWICGRSTSCPQFAPRSVANIGVTRDQVLAACTNVIRTAWHSDERRRLYLDCTEENQILFVLLHPTAHLGLWGVATARFLMTGV